MVRRAEVQFLPLVAGDVRPQLAENPLELFNLAARRAIAHSALSACAQALDGALDGACLL